MVNLIPSSISNVFKSSGVEASNGPKANTLAVSDKTTLKDLQDFLGKAKSTDNVRGHMVNGSLVLYTKADPTGKGGKLQSSLNHYVSSSAEQKRGLGKAGVETILKQHLGAQKAVTSNVTIALEASIAKSVKVGSLMVLSEIARARPMDELKPTNPGPSLSDTGMSKEQIAHSMGEAAKLFKSGNIDEAIKQLGKDFAKAFEQTAPDANKRDAFALSTGKQFKQEINELLLSHEVPEPKESGLRHMTLADKIYAAVGSQVGRGNMNDVGELVIGNKTYAKEGRLGAGGNGSVDLYVNKNDRSDRLAFKTINPSMIGMEVEQNKILLEIEKHQQAYTNDPNNVVPMRAGVQLPNGMFGLAMDIAQLGDLDEAIHVLNAAEKKGDLTAAQSMAARLTLIQDSLKGLQSMHDAGNVHRDVKPQNLFIFSGGVVKVADLGDTRSIVNYNIYDVEGQTGAFLAPERIQQTLNAKLAEEPMLKMNANLLRSQLKIKDPELYKNGESPMLVSARQMLQEQMPGLNEETVKALLRDLKATVKQDTLSTYADPLKRDAFAAGITAYQVGAGALPLENFDKQNVFDKNPNAVISRDAINKFSADGIEDPNLKSAVQDLIKMADDLTSWDKSKRINISEALKSPAFQLDGVGSQETRQRIDTLLKTAKNLGDDYLPIPPVTGSKTPSPQANILSI